MQLSKKAIVSMFFQIKDLIAIHSTVQAAGNGNVLHMKEEFLEIY